MASSQEGDAFEELIVDHTKASQIKELGNSIHEIFNVVIEYGDLIKTYIHPSDVKQSISIYGDLQNRSNAKNYIMAIANPEKSESIPISEALSTKIKQSSQFKTSMIKMYQCNLKVVREPVLKVIVQGAAQSVTQVVANIKKELQELNQEQDGAAKKQPSTSSSSNNVAAPAPCLSTLTGHLGDDDDDDVIWISDPYEMFNEKSKTKSLAKTDGAKSSPATASASNHVSSPPVVTPKNGTTPLAIIKNASEDLEHLVGVARKQGYTNEEIDAVLEDIRKNLVRPADLLDYLQLGRKAKNKIKESKTLPSVSSGVRSEPMDVGVTPKPDKEVKKSSSDVDDSAMQTLKEYAAMLSSSTNMTSDDRMSRISKLISGLPDDQKKSYMSKLNKYNNHWSNNHHSNKEESSSEGEDGAESGELATSPKSPGKAAEAGKLPGSAKKTKKRKKKKAKAPDDTPETRATKVTLHSPRRFEAKAFTTDDIVNVPGHVIFQGRLTVHPNANQTAAKSPPKSNHQAWQSPNKMIKPSPNSAFKNNRSRSINSRTTANNSSNANQNLLRPFDLMQPFQFTHPPPSLPANFNMASMNANAIKPSASTPAMNDQPPTSNLKYIVIDGSNIAVEHGKGFGNSKIFSAKGIKIAVDYFVSRGHTQITAMVPRFRRGNSDIQCPTRDPEILDQLENQGYLIYTPSRFVNNRLVLPYDDRFILRAACYHKAVVVSNDNYRDLWRESDEWKKHIEKNLLQYSFVGDLFMVADDPLGRHGPSLDQFLSNGPPANNAQPNLQNRQQQPQHRANNFQPFQTPSPQQHQNFFQQQQMNLQQQQWAAASQDNHPVRKKSNTFSHGSSAANSSPDPVSLTNKFSALNTDSTANKAVSVSPTLDSQGDQANQGAGRKPRTPVQTWQMYEQLKEIFPDRLDEVNRLLTRYPHEMDINVFTNRLLIL